MQEALLYCFDLEKNAAENRRFRQEAYGEHALSEKMCRDWFRRSESGDFYFKDKERPGQPKNFEDEDLQALLNEDRCQTLKQLSDTLNVTEITAG